jgi:hypothetical protein
VSLITPIRMPPARYNAPAQQAREGAGMGSDRDGIIELMSDYAHHADENRFRQWAELFEPEGLLEAFGREFVGREKLERFISKAPSGKHSFESPEITVEGDRARAESLFRFEAKDPASHSRGIYRDELVRRGGVWRFAARRIEFSARGPDALASPAGRAASPGDA